MPDTADHRADMHVLAQERRRYGLPVWDRRINLADVFHNDEMTFEQIRDAVVAVIRNSGWLDGRDEWDSLVEAVDNLAEAEDDDEFNGWWAEIYDHADYDRVWIATL